MLFERLLFYRGFLQLQYKVLSEILLPQYDIHLTDVLSLNSFHTFGYECFPPLAFPSFQLFPVLSSCFSFYVLSFALHLVLLIFCRKVFSKGKYSIQYSEFFFFPISPMTRRLMRAHLAKSLVVCFKHVSGVTALGKPEMAGSNPTAGRFFNMFLDTR